MVILGTLLPTSCSGYILVRGRLRGVVQYGVNTKQTLRIGIYLVPKSRHYHVCPY